MSAPPPLKLTPALPVSPPASHRHLHSFPTRRSSDLYAVSLALGPEFVSVTRYVQSAIDVAAHHAALKDRKSTRLNSSHVATSYAVFCLKKKTCSASRSRHLMVNSASRRSFRTFRPSP